MRAPEKHRCFAANSGSLWTKPARPDRAKSRHPYSPHPFRIPGRQCSLIVRELAEGRAQILFVLAARIPSAGIDQRRTPVPYRSLTGAFALAATLTFSIHGAQAFDETKFPNWKGQWVQLGDLQKSAWDPAKPSGARQRA